MMNSIKALHIIIICNGTIVPKVLIDNGSTFNVMLLITLCYLLVNASQLKHSQTVIEAFDGTKRELKRIILITLNIDLCLFEVEYHVIDIVSTNDSLLG